MAELGSAVRCLTDCTLEPIYERLYSYVAMRDNFCRQEAASLVFEIFQKWGLLLKEEFVSRGSEFFS